MTDEPEQAGGEGRPKFFNSVTGWIGGLTAVVLALAGLRAAYTQLNPSEPAEEAPTEEIAGDEAAAATPDDSAAPAEQEAAAEAPTKYTGTWEGKEATLELRNGIWVETLSDGTVTRYEQLSRNDSMINGVDRDRKLYVRWPTNGGTLEESEDGETWTRSYEVTAA